MSAITQGLDILTRFSPELILSIAEYLDAADLVFLHSTSDYLCSILSHKLAGLGRAIQQRRRASLTSLANNLNFAGLTKLEAIRHHLFNFGAPNRFCPESLPSDFGEMYRRHNAHAMMPSMSALDSLALTVWILDLVYTGQAPEEDHPNESRSFTNELAQAARRCVARRRAAGANFQVDGCGMARVEVRGVYPSY